VRFNRITIHDLGPFDNVDLDLSALSGKLVAVCGKNGSGKTTLLELMPGAMYRACPTRGSIVSLATSRESSVELHGVNGKPFVMRQCADAVSGAGTAMVLDGEGRSLLDSTKVRDCDAWVAKHLPAPEVLYTSSFLAQQSSGFIELKAGKRKEVLLRLLNIERYEALALRARDNARETKQRWDTLKARLADVSGPELAVLEQELEAAQQALNASALELVQATGKLEALRVTMQQYSERARAQQRRQALSQKQTTTTTELGELRSRLSNAQKLLEHKDKLQAAAALYAQHKQELSAAQREVNGLRTVIAAQLEEQQEHEKRRERARERMFDAREAIGDAQKRIRDAQAGVAARDKLADAKAALAETKRQWQAIADDLAQTRTWIVGSKDERIKGLRTGLKAIDDLQLKSAKETAADTLRKDDGRAKAERRAPEQIKKLQADLEAAQRAEQKQIDALDALREAAAAVKDLKPAELALAGARENLALYEADAEKAGQAAIAASLARTAQQKELRASQMKVTRLSGNLERDAKAAEHADKLERAQARVEELGPTIARVERELADIATELAALPPAPDAGYANVANAQARAAHELRQCEQKDREAHALLVLIGAQRDHAVQQDLKREALRAELAAVEATLTDWTRLSQDLGKDGLQALEIDCAIPELNELANDLLHHCHGGRFTIELRTDRLHSDGKRFVEDLEVRVIDTVEGRDAPVETYSPGERVILGEALSLAICMVACQRAGLSNPTLVRDESGAALDEDNGRVYVAMLRRAAELVQADKVLFVTHNRELKDLADARIEVGGGTAVIS